MSDPLSAIAARLAYLEDAMATKGDLETAITRNVELGRQIEQQRDDITALKNAMAAIVQQLGEVEGLPPEIERELRHQTPPPSARPVTAEERAPSRTTRQGRRRYVQH